MMPERLAEIEANTSKYCSCATCVEKRDLLEAYRAMEQERDRLAAEVEQLKDWQHTSFNMAMPGGPLVCPVCEQSEAKGHAPDCNAAMFALDARRELKADRDRLAAEVEALKANTGGGVAVCYKHAREAEYQAGKPCLCCRAEKAEAEVTRLTAEVAELRQVESELSDRCSERGYEIRTLTAQWEKVKQYACTMPNGNLLTFMAELEAQR